MLAFPFDSVSGAADLILGAGGTGLLDEGRDLETAVAISLFTDRRVGEDEAPDPKTRGGWWGQAYPEVDGELEGSRIWALLARGKVDDISPRQIEQAAEEALQWLVDDGVCESVAATVSESSTRSLCLTTTLILAEDHRELRFTFQV